MPRIAQLATLAAIRSPSSAKAVQPASAERCERVADSCSQSSPTNTLAQPAKPQFWPKANAVNRAATCIPSAAPSSFLLIGPKPQPPASVLPSLPWHAARIHKRSLGERLKRPRLGRAWIWSVRLHWGALRPPVSARRAPPSAPSGYNLVGAPYGWQAAPGALACLLAALPCHLVPWQQLPYWQPPLGG